MSRRRRQSSITRLPPEQRARIEQLLREDRHTLDEMIATLQVEFAGEPAAAVSRSALHRYEQGFAELTGRMREIEQMAQTVVGELGDGIGEKSGQLLAQAITTLAINATLRAHQDDAISVEEVRKLAVAARAAIDSQRVGVNVRKAVAEEARNALLREQEAALDKAVRTGGLSDEVAREMRDKILGVR